MGQIQYLSAGTPTVLTFTTLLSLAANAAAVSAVYSNIPYVRYGMFQITIKAGATGPVAGTWEVYLISTGSDGASPDDSIGVADAVVTAAWTAKSGRLLKSWNHTTNPPGNAKVVRQSINVDDLPPYFQVLVQNSATAQPLAADISNITFLPIPLITAYV